MKRVILALACTALATPAMAQVPFAARLAYFSPERAFAASAVGQAALADLTKRETYARRQIDARNADLERRRQEFARSQTALSETVRRERQRELARFEIDVQRFIQDAQAELMGARRGAEASFLGRLQPALAAVAKRRELLLVLNADAGSIAWADPSLDITAEVVSQLAAGVVK